MSPGASLAVQIPRQWQPSFHGLSRRDRRGCTYLAYVPDPLGQWDPAIPAEVVADLADAEAEIRALHDSGMPVANLEGVARFLMRSESVASSHMEGLAIGPRRLARAEAQLALGGEVKDAVAVEILGNVAAMEGAVASALGRDFTLPDLLGVHELLLRRSHPGIAGRVREQQNWIGGSSYTPCRAAFVPPPPEHLGELLADLLRYVAGEAHSPLVQAAVAHAQFETLHPFADGNGRVGRALIHVVLRRRGLSPRFVPPISLVLAARSQDYVAGLTAFRHLGAANSPERAEGLVTWLRVFAAATYRACLDAGRYSLEIEALQDRWRAQLGRVRAGSGIERLLGLLPGIPVFTVGSASGPLERSRARTTDAVNALAKAGILVQRNLGKRRYRVYECPDVLALYVDLDRALAAG